MSGHKRGRRQVLPTRGARVCRVRQSNGLAVSALVVETGAGSDPVTAAALRAILMGEVPAGVAVEASPVADPPLLALRFGAAWWVELPVRNTGDMKQVEALARSGLLVLAPAPLTVDAEQYLTSPSVTFEVDTRMLRDFLEALR